jgi:hypothetical protein
MTVGEFLGRVNLPIVQEWMLRHTWLNQST